MAKHRAARSLRRIVPTLIALAFAGALAAAVPAAANSPTTFQELALVNQNSVVKYNCYFDVQRVDNANGVVTGTMQGNAFPASLFGYLNIAHTTINCALFDSSGALVLATVSATADRPKVSTGTVTVTVPYLPGGYALCGTASAVKNNGSTSTAGPECVHS